MQKFYGTKLIQATPMTRLDYNLYRAWTLPADENPSDEGYLVEYLDGGKANDLRHEGYISWSPKEQFEAAYQPLTALSFGHAIVALESGQRVRRAGWNGKGMWLQLVTPYQMAVANIDSPMTVYRAFDAPNGAAGEPKRFEFDLLPWIGMKTAGNEFVPWLASQTDMLAKDWQIVEDISASEPDYDAEIRDAVVGKYYPGSDKLYISGNIHGDRRKRFQDGSFVTSSSVEADYGDGRFRTASGTVYKVTLKA